jgi:CysZ protein
MLKEIIIAIQSYFEAHRFIVAHRLWKWILVPGILYCLLFGTGIYFFWQSSNWVIEKMLEVTGMGQWMNTLDSSWLKLLFIFGQVLLKLVIMLFYFSLFKYLFLILGSPLFAYLSEKTEAIMQGKEYPFNLTQLLKDMLRGIRLALRNTIWQSVYVISILLLSFIPLLGWFTPLIALLVECYYLGFSMLDYTCERQKLSPTESIAFVAKHRGLAVGNGMVFYLMHLVFLLGWILAPSYSVIAATISLHKIKKQ